MGEGGADRRAALVSSWVCARLAISQTIPRAPTFELASGDFFTSSDLSANYSTAPASLYFNANLKLLGTFASYLSTSRRRRYRHKTPATSPPPLID